METAPILELRSLSSARGDVMIIDDVSFAAFEGEAVFFMGAAGSGKSALLKAAAGIHVPSAGEALFRGKALSRMSRREEAEFRRRTGFVFQDAALWANQSLYDNLALPARIHEPGMSAAELDKAVRRAADLVGYADDLRARPADLSSGERRLIGLARAVVLDPELLFLDEPVSNLDEEAVDRVLSIVAALKERGRSILVSSSRSDVVSSFADRVGVLRGGRLVAYGSLDDAAAWPDPALRSVTGRLKARVSAARPEWASGLAGAWAEAMAADLPGLRQGPGPALGGESEPGTARSESDDVALGDIINDVARDADAADGADGRVGKEADE